MGKQRKLFQITPIGLTDNSRMPFGKFKGDKMEDVPAHYLLWLYDNNKCNQLLQEYIETNYDVLVHQSNQ